MQSRTTLGRRLGSTAALVGLAVLVAAWISPPLDAAPDHEIYYFYYFDAAKTQPAGAKYIRCSGITTTGTATSHFTVEIGPACDGWACTVAPIDPYDLTLGFEEICGWRH